MAEPVIKDKQARKDSNFIFQGDIQK